MGSEGDGKLLLNGCKTSCHLALLVQLSPHRKHIYFHLAADCIWAAPTNLTGSNCQVKTTSQDFSSRLPPLTFCQSRDLLHSTCPQAQLVFIAVTGAVTLALCCSSTLCIKEEKRGCTVVLDRASQIVAKSQRFHVSVLDSIFKRAFHWKILFKLLLPLSLILPFSFIFTWQKTEISLGCGLAFSFRRHKKHTQRKARGGIDILHDHGTVGFSFCFTQKNREYFTAARTNR